MRATLFLLCISIVMWFSMANLFERIGSLVDKLIISKIKKIK